MYSKAKSFVLMLIICGLIAVAGGCAGSMVAFEDSQLEKAVCEAAGVKNGLIVREKLVVLETLDAANRDIRSLNGLEQATGLKELNLSGNKISDISPLRKLDRLRRLELGENLIIEIAPLKKLNNLQFLDL